MIKLLELTDPDSDKDKTLPGSGMSVKEIKEWEEGTDTPKRG